MAVVKEMLDFNYCLIAFAAMSLLLFQHIMCVESMCSGKAYNGSKITCEEGLCCQDDRCKSCKSDDIGDTYFSLGTWTTAVAAGVIALVLVLFIAACCSCWYRATGPNRRKDVHGSKSKDVPNIKPYYYPSYLIPSYFYNQPMNNAAQLNNQKDQSPA